MIIKRMFNDLTERFSNNVDSKLIGYIDRFITSDMGDIEKCVVIYLTLGDVLKYSTDFTIDKDISDALKVKDISLDNNEIICKNWSILYHRILSHYGIVSKVIRNGNHYRVEIIHDGTYYSADATNYGGNRIYYGMSDFAKIKFGFKIERFHVTGTVDPYDCELLSKKHNELTKLIDEIYERQGRKFVPYQKVNNLSSKVIKLIERNSRKVGNGTFLDINNRFRIINKFWGLNIKDIGVEKVQLFKSFFNTVFEDDSEFEVSCYTVYSYLDGNVKPYILVVIYDYNYNYLYYLDDGKKFSCYDVSSLVQEFRNRKIVLKHLSGIFAQDERFEEFKLSLHK